MDQLAFDFNRPVCPAEIGEVERLLAWLSSHPGFHTASTIAKDLQLSDRKIRQLAEASDGLVISGPGSPGYCHIYHCDPDTIGHIAETLRSQAKRMLARAIRIRRRAASAIFNRPPTSTHP
jgi:hypothetical protein